MPQVETTPMPVTATRRRVMSDLRFHEFEGLPNGVYSFELLLFDVDVELFFERHDELDEVEAVGVEVVGELGLQLDLRVFDRQDFDRAALEALEQILITHAISPWCFSSLIWSTI